MVPWVGLRSLPPLSCTTMINSASCTAIKQVVILDKEEAIKGTPAILEQHYIPADRSVDLLEAPTEGDKGGQAEGEGTGRRTTAPKRDDVEGADGAAAEMETS